MLHVDFKQLLFEKKEFYFQRTEIYQSRKPLITCNLQPETKNS